MPHSTACPFCGCVYDSCIHFIGYNTADSQRASKRHDTGTVAVKPTDIQVPTWQPGTHRVFRNSRN